MMRFMVRTTGDDVDAIGHGFKIEEGALFILRHGKPFTAFAAGTWQCFSVHHVTA